MSERVGTCRPTERYYPTFWGNIYLRKSFRINQQKILPQNPFSVPRRECISLSTHKHTRMSEALQLSFFDLENGGENGQKILPQDITPFCA